MTTIAALILASTVGPLPTGSLAIPSLLVLGGPLPAASLAIPSLLLLGAPPPEAVFAISAFLALVALLAGWPVAAWAVVHRWRAHRRFERIACAEHELRAPVAVLRLTCDRMAREAAGRRYARSLEVEVERLTAGLSDLTAARTGTHVQSGRPGGTEDLRAFAGGALAGWAPALRAAGRRTRLDWKAGSVALPRDRGRVAQALGNLVGNAAEHGAGEVELRGRRVPGGVRIEVRNRLRPKDDVVPAEARIAEPGVVPERLRSGARFPGLSGLFRRGGRVLGRGGAPEPPPRRGRGLSIAADAARELGGSVDTKRGERTFVAALELPLSEASIRMRARLAEQGETRRAGPRRPQTMAAMPATLPRQGPTRPPGVPPGGPRPQPRPPGKPPRVNRPPVPSPRRNTNARRT